MNSPSIIHINGLCKDYRSGLLGPVVNALADLSLSVAEGEVFGFVGANGAGKSSTIKILTGAAKPTRGFAKIFGVDVSDPKSRFGMGYVPESPSLYEYMTPLELLQMGLRLHRCRVDSVSKHCMRWLDRFDLGAVAHRRIRFFSKGMQQRTALAQAMAIQPRLLILDEPLSGLDPMGRRAVIDILAEYKAGGGTLFLTSHVLHDVERLADRFGLIHKGVLKAVLSPDQLAMADDRVIVRTNGGEPIVGMRQEASGRWYAEISRQDLWALMDSIRGAGHNIVEIRSAMSLESAFMKLVSGEVGHI